MPPKATAARNDQALERKYKRDLREYVAKRGGAASLVQKWKVVIKRDTQDGAATSNNMQVLYKAGTRVIRSKLDAGRYLGLPKAAVKEPSESKGRAKKPAKAATAPRKGQGAARKAGDAAAPRAARGKAAKARGERPAAADTPSETAEQAAEKRAAKVHQPRPLAPWQLQKVESVHPKFKAKAKEYLEEGYTVFRRVLSLRTARIMLNGSQAPAAKGKPDNEAEDPDEGAPASRRGMRVRKGNQCWMGAVKTIDACIRNKGGTETVLSPLATREHGRYDMPLPFEVSEALECDFANSGVLEFTRQLCKNGRIRTQDIMLSKPGSVDQRVHTDSSWVGKASKDPRTHYMTILIPLTRQDAKTGGTRVWPRSHRSSAPPDWSDCVDMIEPRLRVGDALVFDGLLSHQGMANVSAKQDRYFYYAAFASAHDPNTEVTGT